MRIYCRLLLMAGTIASLGSTAGAITAGQVDTFQGGAASIRVADTMISQNGSGADNNMFIEAKGTGAVALNSQNGATGGLIIGASGTPIKKHLSGTKTWDPAATAATQGAKVSTTVTVTGAAVGDTVVVAHTAHIGGQAAILQGYVSAADTVTVDLINTTAAAVDLATGTLRVDVWKH